MDSEVVKKIISKIELGEVISPFLFLGQNLEIVNSDVENIAREILTELNIPKEYLYILRDSSENIKLEEIKPFIGKGDLRPNYRLQIFLIENISRFTLGTSNSLLKFFEEPGIYNLIFLSNKSESSVMDTILSRVQNISLGNNKKAQKNDFFYDLIDNYIKNKNNSLIQYFFSSKIEKEDYISFLENLIIYSRYNFTFIDKVEEINNDINKIQKNNINPKYIVDKYLLTI